jgi:glycosyltransferase involved in cell wall biosynthesis
MKVAHIANGDLNGGANAAAYRIHLSLTTSTDINSALFVGEKLSCDPSVIALTSTPTYNLRIRLSRAISRLINRRPAVAGLLPSKTVRTVKNFEPDVINLHRITNEIIAIYELPRLKNLPIVWTLHDMSAFLGTESYVDADPTASETGYTFGNSRPIDFWVWKLKQRYWKDMCFNVVAPSKWLADCVRKSALFGNMETKIIPYPINTEIWRKINREEARAKLNIMSKSPLVCYGSAEGISSYRKGGDLFRKIINRLKCSNLKFEIITFGSDKESLNESTFGVPLYDLGKITTNEKMVEVFSASDVFLAPYRQDNLPNILIEAAACNLPVMSYDVGGIPDIVESGVTGYLHDVENVDEIAASITDLIGNPMLKLAMGENARDMMTSRFSNENVSLEYSRLYQQVAGKL